MYGRRRLWLIGLVVFTGASALCGFATSTLMLQLSRGLQGVGGAIMFAVSLALLANAFRGKDRGAACSAASPRRRCCSPSSLSWSGAARARCST
jgi:MFS family permease